MAVSARPEHRDFNKRVLQTAFDEINEKTDIKFTYEPIFKRNKIIKIQFHVTHTDEELEKTIETEEQQKEEPVQPEQPILPEKPIEENSSYYTLDDIFPHYDSEMDNDDEDLPY